jgi:hypothetical protein
MIRRAHPFGLSGKTASSESSRFPQNPSAFALVRVWVDAASGAVFLTRDDVKRIEGKVGGRCSANRARMG